jgi:hypothetical protein
MKDWKSRMKAKARKYLFSILLIVSIGFVTSQGILAVSAQTSDDGWTTPVNLSHSGATTDPVMVIDSEDVLHIIWTDEFAGFVYTSGDGTNWSEPVPVLLPFDTFKPLLVADNSGNIHAFWVDEYFALSHSQVIASGFATASSWTTPKIISDSAVDWDAVVDAGGNIHLSYIRTLEAEGFPAGVYHAKLESSTNNWSTPVILYESLYLRSLTAEDAHIQIATSGSGDGGHVYVVWDNRPRARVFLVESDDSGNTWGTPQEIDKPEEGQGSIIPTNLLVNAKDDKALLLWQVGNLETGCDNYYQWSLDGGNNWQLRQPLFDEQVVGSLISCLNDVKILDGDEFPFLLLNSAQIYLQVWNGSRWSDPQVQNPLESFVDPETQKTIELSCIQAEMRAGNQLYVAGCEPESGDIWFLQRQITDVSKWFPQDPVWSSLVTLTSSASEINNPVLIADANNYIHAFWSQSNSDEFSSLNEEIYYARWDGVDQWTTPGMILASPEDSMLQPDVALDPEGNLLLVWNGGRSGKLYFSKATANQAMIPSEWSEPISLPTPQLAASSADILVGQDGFIFVTYAIPLNQGLGIYLTHSEDGGAGWSEPIRVFDGVAAGWAMAGRPRLSQTEINHLHLLWTQYSLPSGSGPLALYYSKSMDGGASWSEAELITDKAPTWSEIVGAADRTLHRFWQERGIGGTTVWHEFSADDGQTWNRFSPISVFGETVSLPSLARDQSRRLQLLQLVNRGGGSFVLQHLAWDGSSWGSEINLDLEMDITTKIETLVATLVGNGDLGVFFPGKTVNITDGLQEDILYFVKRSINLSAEASATVPSTFLPITQVNQTETPPTQITPTQMPSTPLPTETELAVIPSPSATPTPGPTATLDLGELEPGNTGGILGSSWVGLLIVAVLVVIIVAFVFWRRILA